MLAVIMVETLAHAFIVSIVHGSDLSETVPEALELLGGVNSFFVPSDHVLIKPNVCGGVPEKVGTYTSIEAIKALVKELKDKVKKITIGESNSSMYLADKMFEINGIKEMANTMGIEVVNLSEGPMMDRTIEGGYVFDNIRISQKLDGAKIISMPVAKTHCSTDVTLNLKNMFGILPKRKKGRYHKKIDPILADINKAFPPTLSIVDASTCLEGEGPFHGNPVELDLIVAGNNAVAVDSVMATIMGYEPQEIMHIRLASELGLGPTSLDEIKVLGESIESVAREFEKAPQENVSRPLSWVPGLGHFIVHYYYETAVRNWKKQTNTKTI
jgi:uncharacterized protein (DUF362 family)